ncbi:unnamed protein product, partial [Mesorhabditis belari]|uniref:Uncharacterized protein n=1 Tax=Mesorhabditis belari TaxID=2138241 RepID=A0AAF3E9T4_9BILA
MFLRSDSRGNNSQDLLDDHEYLVDEYFPVLLVLCNSTDKETESLEKYLEQRTYAELKRVIDLRTQELDHDIDSKLLKRTNLTEIGSILKSELGHKYLQILEAYHNASVYAIIRGLWNSQLYSILPPIDQFAILDYFEEKLNRHNAHRSMWQRFLDALQKVFSSKRESSNCGAEGSQCVRRLAEGMSSEERARVDQAADNDDLQTLENAIDLQLAKHPDNLKVELKAWKVENYPPVALLNIVNDATEEEKIALQRLRKHGLLSSLKTYYRAMIEMKDIDEQKVS